MTGPKPGQASVYETDEPVLYERRGAVALISLNRPRYANAQNAQLTYALDAAFARAGADDAVGAIILRGEGKHFCSGHDISSPGDDSDVRRDDRRSLWWDHSTKPGAEFLYAREQEVYLGMCRRWRDLPKPTLAAVQGACIAGGLMLAWVCDLIVASDDAYFVDPVLRMGVPGVEYFAHAFEMHPRIAREFLFMGEPIDAGRAYQLGMVNRVTASEDLDAVALSMATRIAQAPRLAAALAKLAFNHLEDLSGKRSGMDAVFHMHHLAHAHNQLSGGKPFQERPNAAPTAAGLKPG